MTTTTTVLDDARCVGIAYLQDDSREDKPMELPDKAKHSAEHAKEAAAEHTQRIAHAAEKAEAALKERREKLHERLHEAEEGDVRWHHMTGPQPDQREHCDREYR
jgi:hypothetical protein